MHRDIKPENILLRNPGNFESLVLADFGFAAYKFDNNMLFKRCGTPGFVAPEVLTYNVLINYYYFIGKSVNVWTELRYFFSGRHILYFKYW